MRGMKRISLGSCALIGLALLSACSTPPKPMPESVVARFVLEASEGQAAVNVTLPVSGVSIRAQPKPVITEFDIAGVAEAQVEMGRCLAFRLTGRASRDLYRLSVAHLGSRLILVIDGQSIGARVIDRAIEGGVIFIFAEMPDEFLPRLVENLNHTVALLQAPAEKSR